MMAESTSKLRAQVAALTNIDGSGGFDIMQDEDTFKSVYDIMLGISKVWDDMTDVKQSALLELLAGKVRSNQVAALLNNMSRAEEILKTSQEATGTMDEVHARWLDSIVAKQAQLTASWENLSQTVVNSDMVKMFYDSGAGILNTLDSIISKVGALGPVLSTIGTALFAKTGGGNAYDGIRSLFDFSGKKYGTVDGGIIEAYNNAYKTGLDKQQAMAKVVSDTGKQMNGATEFAIKYSKGLVNVADGATVTQMKISALGAVLKNVGINLAVSAALTALGAGLKWAADEWDKYANAEQYATQAADDAAAKYKEAQDSVTSLEKELASLQKQYDELKNKGPLSFVEEQTKSDLAQATAELSAQLELEKKIALERKRESHESNKNAWKSTYYPNTSLPARLKNSDVYTDATKLLDFNEVLAGAKEGYDYELSVVSDAADYIERGFYKSDVEGAIKLFQHLKKVQIEYNEIAAQTNEEWLRTDYADLAKDADNLAQKLEGGLLTTYKDLTSALKEMREYGETNTQEYKDYLAMRNAIGKDIEPVIHQQQLLAELREDDGLNETYQALENLAKQSEITANTLNQQEYDAFRAAFVAAGGDVKYLIDRLNELRVAAKNTKVSETVASDIKTQVESLLGNKSTGASIFKNTGFGTAALTEDDYKKIADMNDRELLKAVENSHGTAFFNQQAFNNVIDKRLNEQYNKMYDDMLLKQAEYVEEAKSLEEDLLKYQQAARDEELKALREKIDASAKNLNTIQDEINMYNRLAEQIRQSQTAFGRWQTAHGAPEEGDNYDKALEAYQDLLNGFKSGRVGNASYRAAEEYLLGSSGDFYNNKAQRDLLKRYLTKGKNDRGEGARNFQKDAIKKGILNSDGTINGQYRYIEDIASAMGIGVDLAEHMFGEMNEFIADANKKYKVNRRPLEESARSAQYADYIDRRAAYQDALANYKQNNGDQASLKVLMEAYNAYVKAAGDVGIGEESLRNQEIVSSNDELAGAIGKQTGATEEATAAMSDLTTALNDKKEEEAKKAEEEAKRKAEEEAKRKEEDAARKAVIEEQKAAFTKDVNEIATNHKINKQASYKDGIWTVTDNETGTATNYNDASALLIGMFGAYASGIQDDIATLTAAALQVTSNMEQGAAKFGEKALTSFNEELIAQGKDPLGIAQNGKFVVNGEEYDAFFDALGAILGEKFDETEENRASGVKLINTMLKSVGKEGYTATYADGMYNVYDKDGGLFQQYITAQDALWDLGKGPISDFAVSVREANETIKAAKIQLEGKIEEGKAIITDLATGESQEVESLAAGLQAKLQEKISAAQLSFGEFARSVNSLVANYQINSIATSGAFASLSNVINTGADGTAKAIQALNDALDAKGIKEKIGLTADGHWAFGDAIFETFDDLIEAAFGQIQLNSPIDGEEIVQKILKDLGEESFIKFNQDNKKYELFDKDKALIGSFDTYTEAITAITSGSASQLAQLIGQINQAYSEANTDLRAIIEDGKLKRTNLQDEATETYELTDQNIATLAQGALDKLTGASEALANVKEMTVTVTANGSIQLTSKDGSQLFEFGDLSSLIQAAVASGISKALAEKNGGGEDNNAVDNAPPEPERPAAPTTPPHQTNLPSNLIGTVVDIVEANQGVIDAATIATLKQMYDFDAVRGHAGKDGLIANAGNGRLSDDAIAHFLYSLIDNHPELNEQFLNKGEPEAEKPAAPATPQQPRAWEGNVDLNNRPRVPVSKLIEAGWNVEDDGTTATVFSNLLGGPEDRFLLHLTPILDNGEVLDEDALWDYFDYLMGGETPEEILSLDMKEKGGMGLLLYMQEVSGNWDELLQSALDYDEALHEAQKAMLDMSGEADATAETMLDMPEAADATAETVQSIFGGRDWWDVPDSDIEKIKQLYDFDLAREQHPNFAGLEDRDVAWALNQLGEGAEQYRKQLSEEPAEVPVEADTTKAQSSINALGAMDQTVTVTANVVYNDPGFTPNVSGGGGANVSQTAAAGTTNAAPGTSLVDEQGAELIEHVSRGTFELGTDNGPRLTQLDRGDIVHTAEETKKIKRRGLFGRMFDAFRNGGVKRGGAFAAGRDLRWLDDSARATGDTRATVSGGDSMTNGKPERDGYGGKSKKNYIKDALKWAEKLVDWIPTALDILKKKTQDYIKAAEKAVGYLSRNSELDSAIENTRAEIDLNTKAVNRYKKQANDFAKRARLSSDIVKLIHEGTIDIRQYDEDTRKAIQTYQTWWDKAKGCLDTIESLNDQLYDLSKQKLDNIVDYYSNINDLLEEQIKAYNGMVEVKEAYGHEMTRDDYLDAIRLTTDVIENLSEEYDSLDQELTDQVNSGIIKVGSDDWYNYAKQLETLKSTIDEAKVSLSELNDNVANIALNNLQTSIYYLDDLQNKIEGLQKLRSAQGSTEEVNSYRSLISNGMKQIENIQQQNAELEKQLDGLDVLSEKYQEIYKQIQDNKDEIMDIKASQEQWNDAILDLKIDLLQKQNEKYQQRLDIMNALNDLEDARQRRVLMYNNETGFGYVQDEDAVEKAQDAVNDQIYNLVISGLEEQKSNNNIYDNMGNQLIPVQDMLSSVDFTRYYDSINRGSENSTLLTNILKNIDLPELLEGTKGGDVSIDIGDIILNGVNDAEALGDAIIAQLPGYLVQAIYAKGG